MSKIEYRKGCVVTAWLNQEFDVFAHGANCQKTMGHGVAKVVRDKIPELNEADQKTRNNFLGHFSSWVRPGYNQLAANLYTQFYYGTDKRNFNYGAFCSALTRLSLSTSMQIPDIDKDSLTLGIPKIGAGLGGGDWEIIEEIVEHMACRPFAGIGIFSKVYVYTL